MAVVPLSSLVRFLDFELSLSEFPRDDSVNGLQVEGCREVRKVCVSVDASREVFAETERLGADLLFVHHGLIWGGIRTIQGIMRERIKALFDAGISLYACHLPLDWHPEYGNNIRLLRLLSIKKMGEFGEYHGRKIGYWGRTQQSTPLDSFVALVDKSLGGKSTAVGFGRKVRNVGVVSGGGWSAIYDAERHGIDTFLTGEPSHSAYTIAEELKVNLVFAGHYATETPGVKAVGDMIKKKFGLAVEFIDRPTWL